MKDAVAFAGRETTPDAVRLLDHERVLTTAGKDRAVLAVLLRLKLAALPDGASLGVGRKEHLRVDAATDSVVLPLPALDDRGRQAAQQVCISVRESIWDDRLHVRY